MNGPPPETASISSTHQLHIDIEDEDDANLLQQLPTTLEFITSALASKGGDCAQNSGSNVPSKAAVLIHCAQGTSRSASVAIAYLMQTHGLDPDAALEALKKVHPVASPNEGFMNQLHLFYCMNCTLDSSYVPYRRFLAQQTAVQYHNTGTLDATTLSVPSVTDGQGQATLYRCRKCRILLATSDNILETEAAGQEGSFSWRKRDKFQKESGLDGSGDGAGGGIFVEPLRWMSSYVDGQIQGKLYCPKCNARLGAFNWSGIQNNSGVWITPGFHLHLTRLDLEDPARQAALEAQLGRTTITEEVAPAVPPGGSIRQPRLLPQSRTEKTTLVPPKVVESTFTHLILDCDGVMVDSERPSCEALRRSILKITGFDIPHDFPADFRPVFGMDVRSCVEYYAERFASEHDWGTDLESIARQVTDAKEGIYRDLTDEGVSAFPGVKELIASARSLNLGVAVASSGSPEKIAHNLESSGLAGQVSEELIVSAKYVARGKPAPDVYVEALRRVDCTNAAQCIVVEDAINGLKAAKGAGCFTVAVATSLPADDLAPHADVVFERLADIKLEDLRR